MSHVSVPDLRGKSAFARIDERVRTTSRPDVLRLHQGKTWFPPCAAVREWRRNEFKLLAHEHAPSTGASELRFSLAQRLSKQRGTAVDQERVLITAGASHAIAAVLHAILDHGDEVLVPSPQWLFARGLIEAAGGRAVEVPVFLELSRDPQFDVIGALARRITPQTRAIYFNSPNNPTGARLGPETLAGLIGLAEANDLWLISDNAYENFGFSDVARLDLATLPGGSRRTFSIHTFSKTYAMPGYRVGYVVVPEEMIDRVASNILYTIYSVSTLSQFAALQAIKTPEGELADRRTQVESAWHLADEELCVPHTTAHGGLYTFLDLSTLPINANEFLERCLLAGVTLAPGIEFGAHCTQHARLCFSAVPPDQLRSAIERVNRTWRLAVAA